MTNYRLPFVLILLTVLAACGRAALQPTPIPEPHTQVVVDGLLGPIGMAALPDGSLLVAEEGSGGRDDSAGVTLIMPDGQAGRLLSGLPSTHDSGDLAGVPLVKLSPDGATIYIGNFGQGHLWTLPLSTEEQANGISLPSVPYIPDQLGKAMQRLNNVMLVNPFDMTFDADGVPVVSDASGNGVAKQNPDGTTRFFHRFDSLPNPDTPADTIDPVPTGIARVGDEYYVTLTGGCPYPAGSGLLVAIDEDRNQRTVVDGLNMPIDVAVGPDGAIWVLEFARFTPDADCFGGAGYQVETGRLSRLLPDGTLETVLDGLNTPGAVLPMPDGSLYISEVFPGRILHVTFGTEPPVETGVVVPNQVLSISDDRVAEIDYDDALRATIAQLDLNSKPGMDMREGDTPRARLGQLLFFDPILSGDKDISCATCHHPRFGMADGRVLSIGTGGVGLGPQRVFAEEITLAQEAGAKRRLAGTTDSASGKTTASNPFVGHFIPRNSPTVINSALLPFQFWDGRVQNYANQVNTLERTVNDMRLDDPLAAQALFPVTSSNEMAGATLGGLAPQTIRQHLVHRIRAIPAYVDLFTIAYGSTTGSEVEPVTLRRLVDALAAFERRLIFTDAPWDQYIAGDADALTAQQKRGALLFYGQLRSGVNCSVCHSGDLFTDQRFHNVLAPQLGPGRGHGYTGREDWGRAAVTFDVRDRYTFRTPSLRNVVLSAPYFHSGAYATLEDAIRHHAHIWESASTYDPSANSIPPDLYSSLQLFDAQKQGRTAAAELAQGLPLTAGDVADLEAFLHALADPAATELDWLLPDSLPSGLPLDPLPDDGFPQHDLVAGSQPLRQVEEPTTIAQVAATLPATNGDDRRPNRERTNTETGQFQLHDVTGEAGLDFQHGAFQNDIYADPVAAMGGGICWIDYDNDGWLDLYLVNSHAEDEVSLWDRQGGLPRNALYHNDNGTFRSVSAGSGADLALRGNGCVAADFNADGWFDLYVTADGPNALLWNRGDGTFVEGARAAGVDSSEWNSAAVVGDLNDDGWPDLFVAGYIDLDHQIPKPVGAFPQDYYGIPDRLFMNLGPSTPSAGGPLAPVTFREVTLPAGLDRQERGLGALLSDLDNDGDLDLYIANDGHPNRLYANEPWPGGAAADPEGLGFRFADLTGIANVGDSGSGMGVAGGDYDGDGQLDLFVTNWERELNALYRNEIAEEGVLTFQYSTFRIGMMGLGNGLTGWGVQLADLDHDTDLDLLIANGRVPVTNLETDPQLVRFYRNRSWNADGSPGRAGHFLEWTEQAGLEDVGPLLARGSAMADYDNDGDLDVAINTIAGRAVLLRNEGGQGNWLQVALAGFQPGARVMVELPDGRQLVREIHAGSSYLASEDPRLHFGLGEVETVPRVVVRWPNGDEDLLVDVGTNQLVKLDPASGRNNPQIP